MFLVLVIDYLVFNGVFMQCWLFLGGHFVFSDDGTRKDWIAQNMKSS